jgi:hypothetical protein
VKALLILLAALLALAHPVILLAVLALMLITLAVITRGCLRAAGIRIRLPRWEPWTL